MMLKKNVLTSFNEIATAMNKPFLFILFGLMIASSCRKPTDPPLLTGIITQGTWYVNLMKDNGTNYTAAYTGWKFTFQADKVVLVTDGVTSYSGTWAEDEARDKFILNINSPEIELINISQEWDIFLKTYGRVIFKDDNFNTTQELQFTKF